MNSVLPDLRPRPLSFDEVWNRVDPLATDLSLDPAQAGLASLPYSELNGPGFERLIYELLLSENQRPWFFGCSGQAQYGIDIVTDISGEQYVYQCKNYAVVPSWPEVRAALTKFESEWLNDMSLPAPREFVYCCPQPLNDEKFLVEWETFKDAFQKRTGVAVSFWDRNAIDSRLRRLPDLVAGLFSDSYAELFCGRDEWRNDPWIRVQQGPGRFLVVNRFLDRHNRQAIYIAEPHEKLFLTALEQSSAVAIRGLPGMGKSFLALELSCRLRQPLRRIYYATLKDATSPERLWQSARRRLSLPSVFVLDDCHLDLRAVDTLLERLDPEIRSGKLKIVLNIRDQVGGGADQLDDTPAWLAQLKKEDAIIDLRVDIERTLGVILQLRTDFTGLSRSRLKKLHKACGGDLLLLDQILRNLNTPENIDTLNVDGLLASVRDNYFGSNRPLPTLAKLAALAQFDLVPRADFFEGQWEPGEEAAADPLMTRLFGPQRYQFLHSSLATLVLRALAQLNTSEQALDEEVAAITTDTLSDYFLHLGETPAGSGEFALALHQLLGTQPHLSSDTTAAGRVRAAVIGNKQIQAVIERNLEDQSFDNLGLCIRALTDTDHPAKPDYLELIRQRFRILFERANNNADPIGMSTFGSGLLALEKFAPEMQSTILEEHGPEAFLSIIRAAGTLFEFLKLLENTMPGFRTRLFDYFTPEQAKTLIDKTIAAGRSIGTVGLAMRELADADPDALARLEQAIGAPGFVRLILANGTLFELFGTLQYASPTFRSALLDELTPTHAEVLIDKTIAAGRSIGTLTFAMRELGDTDPEMLARLEQAIGAPAFLRLILANGTLFEMFGTLKHSNPNFRTALLDQFSAKEAEILIDKTIAVGRSIGTLNFAMRKVGDANPKVLARLERTIGVPGFVRLILANGTVFELFRILEYSTLRFRAALLNELTPRGVEILIDKTIASGRSIGTLHLAMRELRNDDPRMLAQLEQLVGSAGFLRLIVANGSLFELLMVLRYTTFDFRLALLDQLTAAQAATLVDKTVAKAQGIESFHYTLRLLANTNHVNVLEELIGVAGWWKLITNCGSLNSVSQITQAMSNGFRAQVIAAASNLSVADWSRIIERGLFLNACDFATKELPAYSAEVRDAFRVALRSTATPLAQRATWFDLGPSRPPEEPSEEGTILRAALRSRLEATQLADLFGLHFREAANGFACCWKERPDLRIELGENLRKILPAPESWPREKGEVAALRLLLMDARSVDFPETEARWLLHEITDFLDLEVCDQIFSLTLLLLVWNISATAYDRNFVVNPGSAFTQANQEALIKTLRVRVRRTNTNQEKLRQLALAGLLVYLFPNQKSRIIKAITPLEGATPWLIMLAMEQTFLPALFALEGMALLKTRSIVFTRATCVELLKKFDEYQEVGPAMNAVRLRVEQRQRKSR